MPTLAVPLEEEFKIFDVVGVEANDPIVVVFRQRTQGDHLRRQEMLSRPVTRAWDADNNFSIQESIIPMAKRMAVDVWLTMKSCNIKAEDGKSLLFPPKVLNGSGAFADFEARWNRLYPPEWAQAIYNKCLKLNPDWGFGGPDEIKDEELLTEGEELAGEPATE